MFIHLYDKSYKRIDNRNYQIILNVTAASYSLLKNTNTLFVVVM